MSTIKIKRSGTSSQTPSSLEHGELALNYADGKLFYKDASDNIAELSTGGGAGGGLDSAAVSAVVDETVNDPTQLILGTGATSGVRIGSGAYAGTLSGGGVAIGPNTSASHNSVAIGNNADAGDINGGNGSVSIGSGATHSGGVYNTAVGQQATTSGNYSLALGYSSEAGNYGIALGDATSGQRSIAIGALASAPQQAAIHINANYNSGVGPTAAGGLVIETQSARLEYSADSDWVFSAPVTSSEFKFSDGTSMTTAPAGGGTTYSIDETGRDNTGDWIQFASGVGNNQDRVFFKSRDTANTYRGTNAGFQFDGLTSNQAFVMEDGGTGVKLIGYHYETGADEGLEIEGKSATGTKSTVYLKTNTKTAIKMTDGSVELPSIPTTDPSNANEIWSDGGVLVMSGSTAPSGGAGGGLDSAGVQTVFDNQQSIRLGEGATTQNASGEVAIGYLADATGADAIAIGYDANATALFSLSLGRGSNATYEDAIAIGRSATSSQADTIAMGTSAVASASRSVAIGNGTGATGSSSVALGNSAQALAGYSISIGTAADTNTNTYGIAIGSNTEVTGAQGISIGQNAEASQSSVAIGTNSSVTTGTNTTAVGPFAGATGSDALALGRGAKANADNTIVLAATGSNSTVSVPFGIDIRTSAAGSLTYNPVSEWTFGAGVSMTDLTASGATVIFSNLPTVDPVNAGQLWSDGGTLKVSSGV